MMKDTFIFSYAVPETTLQRHGEGPAHIDQVAHMLRDGHSQQILLSALPNHRYTDTIPNYPSNAFDMDKAISPNLPVEALLLLATRPPMNDEVDDRKSIARSGTDLEEEIFDRLAQFIGYSSRTELTLIDANNAAFGYKFRQNGPAYITRREHPFEEEEPLNDNSTLGVLIYEPSAEPPNAGPALLACFGMSGMATLAFALHLRAEMNHEVLSLSSIVEGGQPRLVAAEFELPAPALLPPTLGSLIDGAPPPQVVIDANFE